MPITIYEYISVVGYSSFTFLNTSLVIVTTTVNIRIILLRLMIKKPALPTIWNVPQLQ